MTTCASCKYGVFRARKKKIPISGHCDHPLTNTESVRQFLPLGVIIVGKVVRRSIWSDRTGCPTYAGQTEKEKGDE